MHVAACYIPLHIGTDPRLPKDGSNHSKKELVMTFNLVEFVARLRKTMGRIRAASTLVTIATDKYKTAEGFAEMISTVFDVEVEKDEDIQFLYKGELFIFDALQVLSYEKLVLSCRSLDNHNRCLRLNRENADEQSRTFYEPGELIAAICAENFIVR